MTPAGVILLGIGLAYIVALVAMYRVCRRIERDQEAARRMVAASHRPGRWVYRWKPGR